MKRCQACGEPFALPYSTSEKRYCSRDCAKDGRRIGRTEVVRWTDEEIGELCELDHLSARQAAKALGRTAQSVQHMRNKLRSGWSPEKEAWTDSEIDFVRVTPNLTAQQVAEYLGRSYHGVEMVRHRLRTTEGMTFGEKGGRKNPHEVGRRRLLAKTCLGCGILLDASWFSYKKHGSSWQPKCNRCNGRLYKPKDSTSKRDGGKSARATYQKLQSLTRERATRHGQPWLDADHETLRDPDLTNLEKALRLGRTWAATHNAVSQNGYTSKVGKGDPMHGRWVIDNPNAPQVVVAA